MYKILFIAVLLLMSGTKLFAQLPAKPKPVLVRRVNGVVRDSLGKTIPSIAVRLVSQKDTLQVVTSEYGVFNFPAVHSENFTIGVHMTGYHPYYKKYFLNDTKAILVLPPVVMKSDLVQLKEVVISSARGKQERGDTTEFWAKDYIVRDYARLEDMLKRMEGFSTDVNGMLSYHGKPVDRALFNGKKYFEGDVAAAIRELPADIVERIQIVENNADGTGPKLSASDPSSQTLNIISKADKSAAKMYQMGLEGGTQDRYTGNVYAQAFDGGQSWRVNVAGKQEPLGIMSGQPIGTISNSMRGIIGLGGTGGGSGGVSKSSLGRLQYNNKWGLLSYGLQYNFTKTHSLSETEGISEEFFKEGSLKKSTRRREDNTNTNHSLGLDAMLNKRDFTMMTILSANTSGSQNKNFSEIHQTGILENLQRIVTGRSSDAPSINLNSSLSFFSSRKVKLNLSINSLSRSMDGSGHDNTDIYGTDLTKADSSLYLLQRQKNVTANHSLSAALSYVWLKKFSFIFRTVPMLDKNIDVNYRDQVTPGGAVTRLNDLSNDNVLLNYKLPTYLSVAYNYNELFSVEFMGDYEINWQHTRFHLKELDLSSRTAVFLPNVTLRYKSKHLGNFDATYSREVHLPTLLQLNTKPYYTTPFDVVIGNKDLESGLVDRWGLRYNSVVPKIGIDISAGLSYAKTSNDIAGNRLVRIDTATKTIRTETYYLNVKGGNNNAAYYSLSKNLSGMNTMLRFNGRVEWGQQVYFADNSREQTDQLITNHELIASFTPVKWLDIGSTLVYRSSNNRNSLQPGRPLYNNEFNGQINGAVFLPGELKINFSATQNITRASSLLSSQYPFVLNANIEKRCLKKKDLTVSFVVMDAFQQNNNNMISQTVTGYSNVLSSDKSRYFLCQVAWSPQQFTRSRSATGTRRGDGSFVK